MRLEEIHRNVVLSTGVIAAATALFFFCAKSAHAFHIPEMDMLVIEQMMQEREEHEQREAEDKAYEQEMFMRDRIERAENRKRELAEWRSKQDERDRELFGQDSFSSGCFGTHDSRDDNRGER